MPEHDAFDPTHALDGWCPPARASGEVELGALLREAALAEAAVDPHEADATHALDGWRAPAPTPPDLELRLMLQPGGTGPDEAKRARLKARGYEMVDVEDVEVAERAPPAAPRPSPQLPEAAPTPQPGAAKAPELDFQAPPLPAQTDATAFIEAVRLPEVEPPPVVIEVPALDTPPPERPAEPDPRLVADWQPAAWTVRLRCVAEACAEVLQTPAGLTLLDHRPQWLCALWAPAAAAGQAPDLWPVLAGVVAAGSVPEAQQAWLAELPPDAVLWSAPPESSWGLVAELVLHQHTTLRPALAQALRELAEAEQQARLRRMAGDYVLEGGIVRQKS